MCVCVCVFERVCAREREKVEYRVCVCVCVRARALTEAEGLLPTVARRESVLVREPAPSSLIGMLATKASAATASDTSTTIRDMVPAFPTATEMLARPKSFESALEALEARTNSFFTQL
jgi:hypothetical protein